MSNKFDRANFLRQREYAALQSVQYLAVLSDALEAEKDDPVIRQLAKKARACLAKLEELQAEITNKAIETGGAA